MTMATAGTAPTTDEKYEALLAQLASLDRVVLAFSGGVDSTFLLHAAHRALPGNVLAVTFATPYMAEAELAEADAAARALGVEHRMLELPIADELRDNPPDRCYRCKRGLFTRLRDIAAHEDAPHVLDGTNLDDMGQYRPGLRALEELGVVSPLRDAALTKADIRELSRRLNLPTWDKPAAACLLSRIPHGTRIQEAELRRIEAGEAIVKAAGFDAVRLRSHGDVARIEVPRDQVAPLVAAAAEHDLDTRIKALGYRHVSVDLAGYRTGSLDRPEQEPASAPRN